MLSMRDKRVLGPERNMIQSYESLVPARGVVLFSLKYDSQFIKPGEPLQLVNDSDDAGMHPAEIILYVKNPVAEASAAKRGF